jgi:oligopeptide transport system substrate-binding protein
VTILWQRSVWARQGKRVFLQTHKRIWLRFFACLLLSVGVSGIADSKTVLHRSNAGQAGTLDPHLSIGAFRGAVLTELFEGVVSSDGSGNLVPALADSWTISLDETVYTFHIKEGLTWSDGTPLNAHDFVYSFRRLMDPQTASRYATYYYPIVNGENVTRGVVPPEELGVAAPDDHTVVFSLSQPTPYIFEILYHEAARPVPRHAIEKFGQDWVKPENMVTSGPYRLVEYIPNTYLKLARNDAYYEADQVSVDEVLFYPMNDNAAAVTRFRAGEYDEVFTIPRAHLTMMQKEMPEAVHIGPMPGLVYYAFNTKIAPFDDVRVRRALSMAVDRELIAERIVGSGETPAHNYLPQGLPGYVDQPVAPYLDIPKAQTSILAPYLDVSSILIYLESDAVGFNTTGFNNAEFDEAVKSANRTSDLEARAKLIYRAEEILLERVPVIPLYNTVSKYLLNPKIKGWAHNVRVRHPARYMSFE